MPRRCPPAGLSFLIVAAAAALARVAGGQTVVRVLDYNIHRDVGNPSSEIAAQPALAKIVKCLAPDVWTINELGGNSPDYNSTTMHNLLAAFIDDYDIFGPAAVEGQDYHLHRHADRRFHRSGNCLALSVSIDPDVPDAGAGYPRCGGW